MTDQRNSVFMIGWEYPPHNSGGLGEACRGLTEAMAKAGSQIYFTLPYQLDVAVDHMQVAGCYNPDWFASQNDASNPPFLGYASVKPTQTSSLVTADQLGALPESELEYKVSQYAEHVLQNAAEKQPNLAIVHAHDWMSYPAAAKIKKESGKPFVAHIHSTEFDRIPNGSGSQFIHQTEYEGLQQANRVIAVSHYTKRLIVHRYQIDPNKIDVVHNGIDPLPDTSATQESFAAGRPVIVFMGRLTMQKGVEYFLQLAQAVLTDLPDALFIVAGHGDQFQSLLLKNASSGLSAHLLFTGFLRGQQKNELLRRADVFVMPSLSEPFGLVALEAAQRNTPVIISRNSGAAEVLTTARVVDFWDVQQMATEVVSLVQDQSHQRAVVAGQHRDLQQLTWQNAAQRVTKSYMKVFG